MTSAPIEKRNVGMITRALAVVCRFCPLCRSARQNQGRWKDYLRSVEPYCPFCRAYRRCHGPKEGQ